MKHAVHRLVPVLLVVVLALASVSSASAESATGVDRAAPSQAAVVHNWEQTSIDTIYKPPAGMTPTPIPVGVLYLGFTSLAMYRAAQAAGYARASQVAAIAVAAHDVLVAYYPDTAGLDEKLAASLSSVPDGWAKQRGTAIGAFIAHRLIKSREDDGRNDTSIVYSKPPQPGIWQPQPAEMLAPWLGFVDPLVLRAGIKVDGPDPITGPTDGSVAIMLGRNDEDDVIDSSFASDPLIEEPVTSGSETGLWDCDPDHDRECEDPRD